MKKVIFAVGVAAIICASAGAGVFNIDFKSTYGVDGDAAGNPLLPNIGDSAKIQLIFAGADNVISGSAQAGGGLVGDDVLLEEWTFTNVGGTFSEQYANFTYGHNSTFQGNGYVYGRVFADANAAAGTLYADWNVQQMSDVTAVPLPTPEAYDFGGGAAINPTQTVVPEPGTIGLMGIAGLGIFMSRRKLRR